LQRSSRTPVHMATVPTTRPRVTARWPWLSLGTPGGRRAGGQRGPGAEVDTGPALSQVRDTGARKQDRMGQRTGDCHLSPGCHLPLWSQETPTPPSCPRATSCHLHLTTSRHRWPLSPVPATSSADGSPRVSGGHRMAVAFRGLGLPTCHLVLSSAPWPRPVTVGW
jgi:hypothetical protein